MREKMQVTGMLIAAMAAGYLGGLMSQDKTAAVAAVSTPASAEVVRAKGFELVDAQGKVRGSFTLSKHGEPMLALKDTAGELRGVFGINEGEPGLPRR